MNRILKPKTTKQVTRLYRWLKLEADFHGSFKSPKYHGYKMGMPNQLVFVFEE